MAIIELIDRNVSCKALLQCRQDDEIDDLAKMCVPFASRKLVIAIS